MRKKTIILGVCIVAFVGSLFVLHQSGLVNIFQGEQIKATVLEYGALAPLMYIGFYALASVLFIPGSPITLAGGALFGPWYGTLYTVIGATIGALLAFMLSRAIGHRFLTYGSGRTAHILEDYDEKIKKHGFLTVLFLRFVPLFPFNALNFALGFTKVSVRDYFFGTLFGIIPGTFAFVYFGDSLSVLSPLKIITAVLLVVILSVLGKIVLNKYGSKR